MQFLQAHEIAALVEDGDTVLIGGSGHGHAVPEALIASVEARFLSTSHPRWITTIHPVGLGDGGRLGVSRLAKPGLLKRVVTSTLVDSPLVAEMAEANRIESYILPLGALSLLCREVAAGRPGLLTRTGLHTFVDPRRGGGKQNEATKEDLVDLVNLGGEEWLLYKPFKANVAFLRGTSADPNGNISMEDEPIFGDNLSMAQAVRRAGGIVIVEVKKVVDANGIPPKQVKIPGILVDYVVVNAEQRQTYATAFSAAYAGHTRVSLENILQLPLDPRKIVARRAALELFEGAVCNLGSGISNGIANVAAEEEILDRVVLTNEQGLIGGAPASGEDVGAGVNYTALIDMACQFDFYDGGGLDLAFLSFAELDSEGNVNVSRFGGRIIGCGGFINISQNAKKVVFSGTFTAGGLQTSCREGRLHILREGKSRKFVRFVEQVSYNGRQGWKLNQAVIYVTERAVFAISDYGIELIEIAPGIDLQRDVLGQMDFAPRISARLRQMDSSLFSEPKIGLAQLLRQAHHRKARLDGSEILQGSGR